MSDPEPGAYLAFDDLLDDLLHTEDDALRAARADTAAAGLPPIEVSAQQGRLLRLLAVARGARRVLEIGTLGGYSTINLARGAGPAGRVVTLEFDPRHAEVATANLARAGVADRVEVVVGAALDTLPRLAERGDRFDMFFIDADKENNRRYLDWALQLALPRAVIILDNIVRGGLVLDPDSGDAKALAVRESLTMMGEHPRLAGAGVQTVGAKGWDGFAVAIVDEDGPAPVSAG